MPSPLERLRALRRSLPGAYWVVWVGTLINRAGGFVVPLLTYYLVDERHLRLSEAGLIVSLYGAGAVGAALVGGVLADRFGRRATMALSMISGAVVMTGLGFVEDERGIAGLVLVLGFVGELYRPAVSAFVADVVPPEDRLRAYGLLYWAINLGFAIAPLAAGLVAGWSYTALFFIDGATMGAFGVLVLLKLPETRPVRAPDDTTPRIGLGHVLRDGPFIAFVVLGFAFAMMMYQSTVALSAHFAAQGHSARAFGAVIAVNGIAIVLIQPWLTARLIHRDPSRVVAFAALLTGVGFALHGVSAAIVVHIVAVLVWTIGEIVASPVHSTMVANLAPAEARGRYQGVFTMSFGMASFLGPLLGAAVLEDAGPDALWLGCLAVGAVTAAGYLLTAPARRARLAAAG